MYRKTLILITTSVLTLFTFMTSVPTAAAKDELKEAQEQASKASRVFQEVMDTPDRGIPRDLLDKADCVAVFPSIVKAAFIFGGEGGRGVVSCRNEETGAGRTDISQNRSRQCRFSDRRRSNRSGIGGNEQRQQKSIYPGPI